MFHGYGAYPTAWIERDGELVFGTIQPETQDALNRLRRFYSLGIINPEFATMNLDQLVADISGDRVGILFGEWWLPAWPMNHNVDFNNDADWRATHIVTPTGAPGNSLVPRDNISHRLVVSANAPEGAEEALIRIVNNWWDLSRPLAVERFGDLLEPSNGFVWNMVPAHVILAHEQHVNYVTVNEVLISGDVSRLTGGFGLGAQGGLYTATRWLRDGTTFYDVIEGWETPTLGHAWGLYTSRIAHHGGWGLTEQIRENGQFIFNEYFGEPTPTQISRSSILNDMWTEFYARYIMGDLPYEAWDTFVSDWWNLGGEAWTNEVNEQFRALQ